MGKRFDADGEQHNGSYEDSNLQPAARSCAEVKNGARVGKGMEMMVRVLGKGTGRREGRGSG